MYIVMLFVLTDPEKQLSSRKQPEFKVNIYLTIKTIWVTLRTLKQSLETGRTGKHSSIQLSKLKMFILA